MAPEWELSSASRASSAGLEGRALALVLPTDDGTVGTDTITLTNVHLTLALLAREKARFGWRAASAARTLRT